MSLAERARKPGDIVGHDLEPVDPREAAEHYAEKVLKSGVFVDPKGELVKAFLKGYHKHHALIAEERHREGQRALKDSVLPRRQGWGG